MKSRAELSRRRFLARTLGATGALALSGCDALSETEWFPGYWGPERSSPASRSISSHRAVRWRRSSPRRTCRRAFAAMAPRCRRTRNTWRWPPADLPITGSRWAAWSRNRRACRWPSCVRSPSRTQITRHDCVEGWSAIGKWKGARLSALLEAVQPKPQARFVVFHCADRTNPYYESIDLEDAFHPQTILAYDLNDRTLPIPNGAPVRLRVERQLGYKHAKYVMRIELVESFEKIRGGKGGYWEDQGYEWWAGI